MSANTNYLDDSILAGQVKSMQAQTASKQAETAAGVALFGYGPANAAYVPQVQRLPGIVNPLET